MTFDEFASLPAEKQKRVAQGVYAGPEHPLFRGIKGAFLRDHPQCARADLFCGLASSLGPVNALTVTTERGVRLRLPKIFMGLPVIRRSPRKDGGWRQWRTLKGAEQAP